MRIRLGAILLCAASMTLGCAVQGRPFQRVTAPPGNTVIYVYRPYEYGGSLLKPPVTCGDDTARIGPGGYHPFVVPAGHVTCSVQGGESADEVELDAYPRLYYIKEDFGWGVLTGHPHLNPMDADTAHAEIRRCCVLELPATTNRAPTP